MPRRFPPRALPLLLAAFACLAQPAAASNVGRRFPSEMRTLVDRVTGVPMIALTTGPSNDAKIYQTHPQWAADGAHIIFRSSDRSEDRTPQAFAVDEITGEITQLTDGPGVQVGSLNVARKSNKLYFMRGKRGEEMKLVELNLDPLFADSRANALKDPSAYERIAATIPADLREAGGFTLDADEKTAYLGIDLQEAPPRPPNQPVPQVPGGIRAIDLQTGAITKVIDTPFRMGHVQANPWLPGEIIYCNETGGDAPQRMFITKADGSGNRPLYAETPDEWVTHETFIDRDHAMFAIMGHQARLRRHPTGIAVINLRNDQMSIIGQVEAGQGFWHCQGSEDGKWAVGDNFAGSVYLINRATSEITLLTTNHKMRPDHAHPNFSLDGTRILIQSGLLSDGRSLDLMVIPIPEWLRHGK